MKKSFFAILIFFSCLDGITQDTIQVYLDHNFMVSEKDSAKYIRQAVIKNGYYYITDKYINGTNYFYGEFSSINPWIEDGKAIYYNENNSIYANGSFEKGTLLGEWIYHNGTSSDTVFYSSPDDYQSKYNYSNIKYHTKNKDTKALGYIIIDSIKVYIENNFHLPARVREDNPEFTLLINCVIGKNGKIIWHKIEYPPIHQDIHSEISRILKSFYYEADIRKPFSITTGFSFGIAEDTISNPIFTIVEEMPEFHYNNCSNCFGQYVQDELKKTNLKCDSRLLVYFTVEKDGTIEDIEIMKGLDSCNEYVAEIERVIKACPKWKPGLQRDKPVRVRQMVSISIGR